MIFVYVLMQFAIVAPLKRVCDLVPVYPSRKASRELAGG